MFSLGNFLFTYQSDCLRSFRPDGNKKAYVRLSPDVEALEAANKVNTINVLLA